MNRIIVTFASLISAVVFIYLWKKEPVKVEMPNSTLSSTAVPTISNPPLAPEKKDEMRYQEINIPDRSSFYMTLVRERISPETVLQIAKAAKKTFDLSSLNPGTRLVLAWSKEKLENLRVLISGTEELHVSPDKDGDWKASMIEHEVKIELTAFFGEIRNTLWDSAVSAGMPVELISDLSEIFASQVDFRRELDVNDQWSILVEKQMVGDQQVGFGDILAAEISKRGEVLPAFLFEADGQSEYFDTDGNSARGKFLKSPLRYNKVTSRFQKARFHPILKTRRPHRGVDFAAPPGTPIRSVGDGKVLEAGRGGGSGIMVKIRHDDHYMTAYKHMSKIASGVRTGARVEQGQIIGYVGQTGLATGPHLHFEFYENGRYVDPLGKHFPRRFTILAKDRQRFQQQVARYNQLLEDFRRHES